MAPMIPPGGMPPQGGGMPPQGGGMGPGIAQVLQQLMQNPAALKGMMNFMQGQPPTAGMPMPPSKGGQIPPGMSPQNPIPMPPPGGGPPTGAPPPDSETQGPPPGGGPPDGAEAMAQGQIDKAGQTWDGVDAPTKNDIARLKEDPSPSAIKSFDQQFGKGMAEKYLGDGEEAGENPEEEASESPSAETAEYDE